VARGDKAAAAVNGVVHVVGGEHNNECATLSTPVSDVEALRGHASAASSFWQPVADIPEPRFRAAAAAIATDLFFFGGQAPQTDDCPSNASFCFPVTDHTWTLDLSDEFFSSSSKNKKSEGNKSGVVTALAVVVALLVLATALCFVLGARTSRSGLFRPTAAAANNGVVDTKAADSKIEMT